MNTRTPRPCCTTATQVTASYQNPDSRTWPYQGNYAISLTGYPRNTKYAVTAKNLNEPRLYLASCPVDHLQAFTHAEGQSRFVKLRWDSCILRSGSIHSGRLQEDSLLGYLG